MTHGFLHPLPFSPLLQPPDQLGFPYVILGLATPASLYVFPFLLQGGPALAVPARPSFHAGTAWHSPYLLGSGLRQDQGVGASEFPQPLAAHPFGRPESPQPSFNEHLLTSDDIALLNSAFPENPMPAPNPFHNPLNSKFLFHFDCIQHKLNN